MKNRIQIKTTRLYVPFLDESISSTARKASFGHDESAGSADCREIGKNSALMAERASSGGVGAISDLAQDDGRGTAGTSLSGSPPEVFVERCFCKSPVGA